MTGLPADRRTAWATHLLVIPLPAVIEYLGSHYPIIERGA